MFSTYAEAREWIAQGEALMGKRPFRASEEYKSAHPEIEKLYEAENPAPRAKRVRYERPIFGSFLVLHGNS